MTAFQLSGGEPRAAARALLETATRQARESAATRREDALAQAQTASGSSLAAVRPTLTAQERTAASHHSALQALARQQAQLEVSLGACISHLTRRCELRVLGLSHRADLCPERFGFSYAHGRELRSLAEGLGELPLTRDCFLRGRLGRARARDLVSVATRGSEEGWLEFALSHGTRELHRLAQAFKEERCEAPVPGQRAPVPPPEPGGFTRLDLLLTPAERALFEHAGRPMVEGLIGHHASDSDVFEAIAAETLGELGCGETAGGACTSPGRSPKLRGAVSPTKGKGSLMTLPFEVEGRTAVEIDQLARKLVRQLRILEWERGRLLCEPEEIGGAHALGHARLVTYASRELGLAPKETVGLTRTWWRSSELPEIHEAWKEGRIGPTHVQHLLEVVEPRTQRAWLQRARSCSFKRFEDEVAFSVYQRDTMGVEAWMEKTQGLPPADLPSHELRAKPEQVFAPDGPVDRSVEAAVARGGAELPEGACTSTEAPVVADGVGDEGVGSACTPENDRGRHVEIGRECVSFWVERDVADMVREAMGSVRERLGEHLSDGECLHVMLLVVAREHLWGLKEPRTVEWSVYMRDGWRCSMPNCRSIGPLHAHHVWWRSAGGPDEPWVLISLCPGCHAMVHAKKVVILLGRGPEEHVFMMGLLPDGRCNEAYRKGERIDTAGLDWRTAWAHVARLQAA